MKNNRGNLRDQKLIGFAKAEHDRLIPTIPCIVSAPADDPARSTTIAAGSC